MPDYADNAPQGYMGDWTRGAPLGRPTIAPDSRTEAQLLADFAYAAKRKSDALRLKENRPSDGWKARAWESAVASFDEEMCEIKELLKALKERAQATPKINLRRVRLDSGGYDPQGAYFGSGDPLYWAADQSGAYDRTFRATDREDAKAQVREDYPGARFYR